MLTSNCSFKWLGFVFDISSEGCAPPPPPRLGLWVWGFGVLVCCCIHQSSSFTSEENVASFSTCVTPAPCFIPSLFVFRQRGVKPLKLGRAAAAAGVSSWLPAPLLLPSSTQMSSLFPLKKIEMSRCVCVSVCVFAQGDGIACRCTWEKRMWGSRRGFWECRNAGRHEMDQVVDSRRQGERSSALLGGELRGFGVWGGGGALYKLKRLPSGIYPTTSTNPKPPSSDTMI